jgi:hypothetical protein
LKFSHRGETLDLPALSFISGRVNVRFKTIVVWVGVFFLFWVALIAGGALLGGTIYPVVGWIFDLELDSGALFRKGVHHGSFMLGLVWGPGLAFVLTVIRAHTLRERKKRQV